MSQDHPDQFGVDGGGISSANDKYTTSGKYGRYDFGYRESVL